MGLLRRSPSPIWSSYRSKKLTECAQLLLVKKEVEYDYVAVDATGLVATALRLAKGVTTEQRRHKEVARHVAQNLQQLLHKVRCRRSLLITMDGSEGLARAALTRQSAMTRRLESRLARLPGTPLMQAVEDRLVKMMPNRPALPAEVVFSGTCVSGSVEAKMAAWALDVACKEGFDGNTDSVCLIGPSELYLVAMGMTPFYNVSSLVQNNADLRHLRVVDMLEWLGLEKEARAGDSALVARARTDALFLYLLCHGCMATELGVVGGLSFPHLMDRYHLLMRGGAPRDGTTTMTTTTEEVAADPSSPPTLRYLFTEEAGDGALRLDMAFLGDILRTGARSPAVPRAQPLVEDYLEHLLQTHAMLCTGQTPDAFFVPDYLTGPVEGLGGGTAATAAIAGALTASRLMDHLHFLQERGTGHRAARRASAEGVERAPEKETDGRPGEWYPFWSPTQPLTAAEYTLLSYSLPASVDAGLLQYVGESPKPDVGKRITEADIRTAHKLLQQALSFAHPERPASKCVCLAPSYGWFQNEKSKLWRMAYVDLGERGRQRGIRRLRSALSGVHMQVTAAQDGPVVFEAASGAWVPLPPPPDETRAATSPPRPPSLKVLTWNVMFDRYSGQPTPLGMPGIDWCSPRRYPVLAKCIQEEEADLVGMQEVELPFWEFLAAQPWCRENYILSCAATSPALSPWGVLLLVHKRWLPDLQLTYVNVPAWSGHVSWMPVVTLGRRPGTPLHVAVIHLLAPFTKANEKARTAQDGALRQYLTKRLAGDCIAMGDFNDWPTNEFQMPRETQFVECWPLVCPHLPGKTMDETNTFCKLKIEEIFFGRSDKVFLRGQRLKPVSAHLVGTKSVNEENGNTDAPAYLFPSDHYGVSMTFTL